MRGSNVRRMQRRTRGLRGASSVEYAIMVSLIALVIITAVSFFGTRTNGLFQKSCESIASTQSTSC